MWKEFRATAVCGYAMVGIAVGSCSNGPIVSLAGGKVAVSINPNFSGSELVVTVRNEHGSASGTIMLVNDHIRSNIYLTPLSQLVVIEQGGADAFFSLPKNERPRYLAGHEYGARDTNSDRWQYMGVIEGDVFDADTPECIALLGEGDSPYRRQYQKPNFC